MRFYLFALLLGSMTGLLSCDKPNEYPQVISPASTFSAKVDGKTFVASEIQGSLIGSVLAISTTNNAGTGKETSLALNLYNLQGLSSYPIDSTTNAQYVESGAVYKADTGAIAIATNNEVHIAGSFAFNASDKLGHAKSVTAGSFDIYR